MKKLMSERELNHNKVGERVHTSGSNCTVIKFTQDKLTEDTQNTPNNDAKMYVQVWAQEDPTLGVRRRLGP